MPEIWVDQEALKKQLQNFFAQNHQSLSTFGNTVNQTFEAFVFASVVGWYRQRGWNVTLHNPSGTLAGVTTAVRLKFSTRGRPGKYSYFECVKGDTVVQVRHQLRVATHWHEDEYVPPANVCLDVAVIKAVDVKDLGTNDHVANEDLVTFGEAKHMSAFAELVANFEGLVHEMQPNRLANVRCGVGGSSTTAHLAPFLYVSGHLFNTAEGIANSIARRGYDIDIYTRTKDLTSTVKLPTKAALKLTAKSRRKVDTFPLEELPF